jgi:diguanylate cyclase (GGDEF)-like protein
MRAQGRPVGVIEVFSRSTGRRFTDGEQRALGRLAARAAPFVDSRLQAHVDELTDLNDFRFFRQALANEVAAAQRHDRRLGLLAFDLVGLGEINDAPGLGPAAGDTVLRAVGHLARETVRRSDVACRRGGDEFVVLLPECGLDGADQVYRRLSEQIGDLRVEYEGRELSPVGVSGGAVELRRYENADSLFDRADEALDRAKSWGRGRIAWGLDDRSEPPADAAYGLGSDGHACSVCVDFRPGTRISGYCERWNAPVDPEGGCSAFAPRPSYSSEL